MPLSTIRAAVPVLLGALLLSSAGCAFATMMATGVGMPDPAPKDTYDTWKKTMEWMGRPGSEGGCNVLGGTLFALFAAPWFLFDTEAFLIVFAVDLLYLLVHPGHDMHLTKRWCCWWAVLFGSRRFKLDSRGREERGEAEFAE
jgi:hypothetical protein